MDPCHPKLRTVFIGKVFYIKDDFSVHCTIGKEHSLRFQWQCC